MDKIGLEGVAAELTECGYEKETVDKYIGLFQRAGNTADTEKALNELADILIGAGTLEEEVRTGLQEIIASVRATKSSAFEIVFDPTLVRGMSYYTGTIFEIAMPQFGGSCGGGGRYDKMVGRFTGRDVPACGFSIGFERIILLLLESGFQIPSQPAQKAFLIEKGVSGQVLCDVIAQAQQERANGTQVLVARMNKNKKFQKEQLTAEGYGEFKEFYKDPLRK